MATVPPPPIPQLTGLPKPLQEYLQRFSAWAYHEVDRRIDKEEAVPGVLILPTDVKPPRAVFRMSVDHTGTVTTTQIPLGTGKP